MQVTVWCDISNNTVTGALGSGQAFNFPTFTQNEKVTLAIRLAQTVGGVQSTCTRTVNSLSATIAYADKRPTAGYFQLLIGTDSPVLGVNLTSVLSYGCNAEQLCNALNKLTGFASGQKNIKVTQSFGSFFISAADGSKITLGMGLNHLFPISFGYVNQYEVGGAWVQELRLTQAPVANTSVYGQYVPAAPSMAEVQAGGSNAGQKWNEVQALTVPATFLGSYFFTRNGIKSALLSASDGPDQIAAALLPLADADGKFIVTNPLPQTANIEFSGSMGGSSWPLLTVTPAEAPPGDYTLTLDLSKNELDKLLKASGGTATIPLEVWANVNDINNPDETRDLPLIRQDVTIQMAVTKPGATTAANLDWLRPYQVNSYTPFNGSQILTGNKAYVSSFGDGAATVYVIDHNLATDQISGVLVRVNGSNGRMFVEGTDYTVVFNNNNSLTITLTNATPPAASALAVLVTAAPPIASFAEGLTLEIGQVNGLQTILNGMGDNITTLLTAVGINPFASNTAAAQVVQGQTWTFRQYAELFGTKLTITTGTATAAASSATTLQALSLGPNSPIGNINVSQLEKHGGGLLAALQSYSPTSVTALPGSPATGTLYKYTGTNPLTIPGALRQPSSTVNTGECFAWSGAQFYKVAQYPGDIVFKGSTITINTTTAIATLGTGGSYTFHAGDVVQLQTTGTLPAGFALNTDYTVYTDGTHFYLKNFMSEIVTPTNAGTGTHFIGLSPSNAFWYPVDFDRELFSFAVNDSQFRTGMQLAVNVGFEVGILYALKDAAANLDSTFEWCFVIEWQAIVEDSAVIPGPNLGALAWNPVPMLKQMITLSTTPVICGFGVTLQRQLVDNVDTITAVQQVNGGSAGALSCPSNANFKIRGRLCCGDTEDGKPAGKGFIGIRGMSVNPQGADGSGSGIGTAQITNISS